MKTHHSHRLLMGLILSFSTVSLMGQADSTFIPYYKYRVSLKDKKNSEFSTRHPEAFLSQKAIERRKRQHIRIDRTDLPVNRSYISAIEGTGAKVILTSKWNNTVVVSTADTGIIDRIRELACVTDVRKVATYTKPRAVSDTDRHSLIDRTDLSKEAETDKETVPEKPDTIIMNPDGQLTMEQFQNMVSFINRHFNNKKSNQSADDIIQINNGYYGNGRQQIEQLNGTALHSAGFDGKGMVIAIIDGGFYNADIIPGFKNTRILGTKDFVEPGSDIYNAQSHGMMVLSCIGSNVPDSFVGTAPNASFWLLRSEDGDSEQLIEEDNWAAAIEYADSVGADVVNTSLGYSSFDNHADDVQYYELDGRTHLISISASMCADKGMILVNSAGNSGNDRWKLITPPADAINTLTVGAINAHGQNTLFSSLGLASDGRIKPDVTAMGEAACVYDVDGTLVAANGTSFSSPITCGMTACLWQALPNLTAKQIMDIIRKSGSMAEHPNSVYGYGIPDFFKAYSLGLTIQ
ncbi:MAG: S8 family serine peptidase [Bacteroidaceae bacterium]|nr:S8 family serine peptidase [Bacteroidaceae bacterium]